MDTAHSGGMPGVRGFAEMRASRAAPHAGPDSLGCPYRPGLHGAPPPRPLLPEEQRTVLVYDLGGGTFDVTLVRLSQRKFQTLAIEGDVRLGGKDWDDRVVDFVAAQFMKQYGADPRGDAQSLASLRAAAERAKKTLSKLPQTSITCTHSVHDGNWPRPIASNRSRW